MFKAHLANILYAVLALSLVSSLLPIQQATAQTAFEGTSPEAAAIWISELESRGDTEALYELLHPDAKKLVSEDMVAGWYRNEFFSLDPQPISEITSVNYISWTWDVTGKKYHETAEIGFVQPFGTGANQYTVSETVRLVSVDGEWHWFFGRSLDFVNTQRSLYDPESKVSNSNSDVTRTRRTTSGTKTNTTTSRANRSTSVPSGSANSSNCTLVELAPGYPGYRGLVTGLSPAFGGLGDWDCLETLQRDNPGFDQATENQLNLQAARTLGINGEPSVWLWENWMAIESERGLPTHCYTCLMFDEHIQPINISITQDWTDPRIQVGFIDNTSAVDQFLPTGQMRNNFEDNYQFRAHAFLVAGPGANAREILVIYQEIGEAKHWGGFDAGDYIYEVGGYSWVSGRAHYEDQKFAVLVAMIAATYQHPDPIRNAEITKFDQAILDWQVELVQGSDESLVNYLRRMGLI